MMLTVTAELFSCRMLTLLPCFSYLMSRGLPSHPGQLSRESKEVRVLRFWVQQGQDRMQEIWHLVIWVTHLQKPLSRWRWAALKILPEGLEQPSTLALWTTGSLLPVSGDWRQWCQEAVCKDSMTFLDASATQVTFWKPAGMSTVSTTVKRQEFWWARALRSGHGQT